MISIPIIEYCITSSPLTICDHTLNDVIKVEASKPTKTSKCLPPATEHTEAEERYSIS